MAERNPNKQANKRRREDHCPSPWSQLPPDLLTRLSLHVFTNWNVDDVAVIPRVCKSWNDLMDTIMSHTIPTLIVRSLPDPPINALPPQYPCFMKLEWRSNLFKFIHPNHTFTIDCPELLDSSIECSKFGWLLLERHCYWKKQNFHFFFNPFTRQKIDLPVCHKRLFSMSFSSPPTSSHCFVIGMGSKCDFAIIKRGEQKWEFYESVVGEDKYYIPYPHLAICGDCCYAIGDKNKIVVFDVKQKSINFIGNPLDKPSSARDLCNKAIYLVENGEELLSVIVTHKEENIYFARMKLSKQEWLPVETLRNKMLFVCKRSSMLRPAPVEATSNKIYFPKLLNDDIFVPYCLATKKYVSFRGDGDYASGNVTEWEGSSTSTWIETMPFAPASACKQQIDW